MKFLAVFFSFLLVANTVCLPITTNTDAETAPGFFVNLGHATYENIIDLVPFFFTTGISLLVAQLKPIEDAGNDNKVGASNGKKALRMALQHIAVVIPSAFAVSALYGRVATIRDSRKLIGNDIESQNALTRQQDEVIAKYLF